MRVRSTWRITGLSIKFVRFIFPVSLKKPWSCLLSSLCAPESVSYLYVSRLHLRNQFQLPDLRREQNAHQRIFRWRAREKPLPARKQKANYFGIKVQRTQNLFTPPKLIHGKHHAIWIHGFHQNGKNMKSLHGTISDVQDQCDSKMPHCLIQNHNLCLLRQTN